MAYYGLAASIMLLASAANADERVDDLIDSWNRGDSLAVQHHIHGDYARATIGHAAEQGGTIKVLQHRFTGNGYQIELLVDSKREAWILTECAGELSTYFCSWQRSAGGRFGAAERGQAFDVATTGIGLAAGFTEMNPIGLATLPIKGGLLYYANSLPYDECVTWRTWLDSLGVGAGAANLITLIAGIANPAIPVLVMAGGALIRSEYAAETAGAECAAR